MLSICVIARNEEAYLGRLLASLEGCSDIVVLDTGSTDRTLEIAAQFPAVNLQGFAWNGSFADARNAAANHAMNEWIMWLDADMFLPPGELARIQDFLPQLPEGVDGICLGILDGESLIPSNRVCRRRLRFRGRVHEDPGCTQVVATPFRIHHQRSESEPARQAKAAAYEVALLDELAADPSSIHALVYLRDLAFSRRDFTQARTRIAAILQRVDDYYCHYLLARMALDEGDWKQALACGFQALRHCGKDPRVYLAIADAYEQAGNLVEALVFNGHALHLPEEARLLGSNYPVREDAYDLQPLSNLAGIQARLGRTERALACYAEALARRPGTPHWSVMERNHAVLSDGLRSLPRPETPARGLLTVVVRSLGGPNERLRLSVQAALECPVVRKVIVVGPDVDLPALSGAGDGLERIQVPDASGNQAWNAGLRRVDSDCFLLLGEEVLCAGKALAACCNVLEHDPGVGEITVETQDLSIAAFLESSRQEVPEDLYIHCRFSHLRAYGWFIMGRTRDWVPIPEDLREHFGPEWILHQVRARGLQAAKLVSETIAHPLSVSPLALAPTGDPDLERERECFMRHQAAPPARLEP